MTDNLVSELRKCPFCDGKASLCAPRYPMSADCDDVGVVCHICDAMGPSFLCDMSDDDAEHHWPTACAEAVSAWNTRAADALEPSGDVVERVARALDPKIWAIDAPTPTRDDTFQFHVRRQKSIELAKAAIAALGASHAE